MARGITQIDVNEAADALLLNGERPTVDRIRQHLGTGSPNTVTRLLDVWWKALGPRLAAQQCRITLPDAPESVAALASQLWEQALEAARTQAERALATDRESLARDRSEAFIALEAARADTEDARRAADEARTALAQASARAADLQRLIDQQAGQIADLTRQRDEACARTQALDADLVRQGARLEQALLDADSERLAQVAHLRATEDRAHAEVDRARQESRDLRKQLRAAENAHRHQVHELQSALEQARGANTVLARDLAAHQARGQALDQQLHDLRQSLEAALRERVAPTTHARPSASRKPRAASKRASGRPIK